jgi:drug/metabolite transporter (DMT)-like permease
MSGFLISAGAALGSSALFGGMWVVSKDAFSSIPQITLGAVRVLVGGLILWLLLPRVARFRVPRDGGILVSGFALAGTLITQYIGVTMTSATEASMLTIATPLILIPLAWITLRERPRIATVAGIVVGAAGVALAVQGGSGQTTSIMGPTLVLASSVCWAIYTVASAPPSRHLGSLVTVTWSTLVAVPLMSLLSLTEIQHWSPAAFVRPQTLGAVAYLSAGCTVGSWYLWNRGVMGLPAAVTGACSFATPLVGGILGYLFLAERPTLLFAVGGVLILIGVVTALSSAMVEQRKAPK